jgi:hypothetical protein
MGRRKLAELRELTDAHGWLDAQVPGPKALRLPPCWAHDLATANVMALSANVLDALPEFGPHEVDDS